MHLISGVCGTAGVNALEFAKNVLITYFYLFSQADILKVKSGQLPQELTPIFLVTGFDTISFGDVLQAI